MRESSPRAEPITEWMVHDIAHRCREVLSSLELHVASAGQLGNAAVLLRGAADDLGSLVDLVEGREPIARQFGRPIPEAFGLAFSVAHPVVEPLLSEG